MRRWAIDSVVGFSVCPSLVWSHSPHRFWEICVVNQYEACRHAFHVKVCEKNGVANQRMYVERFPNRNLPDRRTFERLH